MLKTLLQKFLLLKKCFAINHIFQEPLSTSIRLVNNYHEKLFRQNSA